MMLDVYISIKSTFGCALGSYAFSFFFFALQAQFG